jgi:hypothetical protein
LQSADDDWLSEPSSATRPQGSFSAPYSQHLDISRRLSLSQNSPLLSLSTPDTEPTSPAVASQSRHGGEESTYDAESLLADATYAPSQQQTGYIGQICEVQWLQKLKDRLHVRGSAPDLEETNFYLDHRGLQLMKTENPFHLPDQKVAMLLFQFYYRTVHITFPIVSADFEGQLQIYYNSVRSGHTATMFPQKWYAIVNLILAIGARFAHLNSEHWQTGTLDETLYISQAYQLLRLDDPITALTPDLFTIQVWTYAEAALDMLTITGYWTPRVLLHGHWPRQQVSVTTNTYVYTSDVPQDTRTSPKTAPVIPMAIQQLIMTELGLVLAPVYV